MTTRTKPVMNPHRPDEPAIRQPPVAGWDISWEPPMPGLWHVADPDTGESVKIYAERRNALAWARRNPR